MNNIYSLTLGCGLAILLTLVSRFLVQLPVFNVLGAMVIAILIGILFRAAGENVIYGSLYGAIAGTWPVPV